MRVLVVGGDSRIGRLVGARLRSMGCDVNLTTRRSEQIGSTPDWHYLELAALDETAVEALPDCDVAIFSAAITRMRDCREEPQLSYRTNVAAPVMVAQRVQRTGGRVFLLSTNAVFDGSQPRRSAFDRPDGLTVYGKQKAEAERKFREISSNAVILRMSKVVEHAPPLFQSWASRLVAGDPITPFSDMVLAPVPIDDAVRAICHIATHGNEGIYQISADHDVGYVEAARAIARALGANSDLIKPASARVHGIPVEELNKFTSLDSSRLQNEMLIGPIDPIEAVLQSIDQSRIHGRTVV